MFKKFLNAILFGALILGSAGTITSCKDYDDEIDEINQKLNTLSSKDELAAQVSSLTSTISAAQSAAAQASTEAANALAAAKEAAAKAEQAATGAGQATGQAAEAITNAKAAATTADAAAKTATDAAAKAKAAAEDAAKAVAAGADATKAIAEAKAAAEAAQKAADEAKAGVSAAAKAATEASASAASAAQKAVAEAQKSIAEAAEKAAVAAAKEAAAAAVKTDLESLTKRIEALEKGGSSADPEELEKIKKDVEKASADVAAIIGKISTAVTSVSIVDSYTAAQVLSSTENLGIVAGQGTWANFYYELLAAKKYIDISKEVAELRGNEDLWLPLSINNSPLDLDFTAIVEYGDWTAAQGWGKWMAEYENEKPFDFYGIGANLKNAMAFKAGKQVNRPDYFVVRVSPTNAVITGDMLQLVNSEGKNLNEFLNLDVRPFEGKLSRVADVKPNYTRAADDSATGLWIVKATLKSPYDTKLFDELTWYASDVYVPERPESGEALAKAITRSTVNLDGEPEPEETEEVATLINKILYAVQVNNTAEDAAERFVTSSYDLTFGTSEFQAANRLHFSVNGTRVEKLNNRFSNASRSFLEVGYSPEQEYEERVWLPDTVDVKPGIVLNAPKTKADPKQNAIYNGNLWDNVNTNYNVGYYGYDDRSRMEMLTVAPGETFTVSLDEYQGWAYADKNRQGVSVKAIPTEYAVKAIYVVLDQPNAVESIPSEWNAWLTYNYTGINEIVEGTSVDITVSGDELISKRGDIIGFRVYAINWDGTLVDPDGRAFYVRVGEAAAESNADTVIYPTSDKDFDAVENPTAKTIQAAVEEGEWPISEADEYAFDAKTLKNGATYKWEPATIKYTLDTYDDKTPKYDESGETESAAFYPVFLDKDGKIVYTMEMGPAQTTMSGTITNDWGKITSVATVPVIPNWLAYNDDQVYSGVLTIYDKYGIEVEKIVITYKKVLPTEAPKGYDMKTNMYFENGVLKLYLKPDVWVPEPETAEDSETGRQKLVRNEETGALEGTFAINGTMILENIFNYGTAQNVTATADKYIVTFAKSDTLFVDGATERGEENAKLDKAGNVQYTAAAVLAGDSTLTVPAVLIDNVTKHATTVEYNYGQISTAKYNKKSDSYGDYTVEVDKFETEYHDIYDELYSWRWITLADYNNYVARYADYGTKLKDEAAFKAKFPIKPEIEYGAGSDETGAAPEYTLDLSYIFGESKRDGVWNAPMDAPYNGSLVVYDATLTSNKNGKEEYFDVIVEIGNSTLTFKPFDGEGSINQLTNPTADVESTLHIKFIDMYSHEFHEATVPMKVLRRK